MLRRQRLDYVCVATASRMIREQRVNVCGVRRRAGLESHRPDGHNPHSDICQTMRKDLYYKRWYYQLVLQALMSVLRTRYIATIANGCAGMYLASHGEQGSEESREDCGEDRGEDRRAQIPGRDKKRACVFANGARCEPRAVGGQHQRVGGRPSVVSLRRGQGCACEGLGRTGLEGRATVACPLVALRCGGETRAYIARSLRFVGVREYVAERGTCQSSSSTCAAMASSSAVIEHGCARVGRAFSEGGRVVLSADHATVTMDGLAGTRLVFTRPQ